MKRKIAFLSAILILSLVLMPMDGLSEKASSFTVTTSDGVERSLEDYSGKVLVLIIMFTTCSVCSGQMPTWVEEYEDRGADVEFLSVSVDRDDTDQMLDDYQSTYGADWPIATDPSFITKFDATSVPRTIIISPDGYIRSSYVGYLDDDELDEAINDAVSGEDDRRFIPFISLPMMIGALGFLTVVSILSFKRKR